MGAIVGWFADIWESIAPLFSFAAGNGSMRAAAFVRYGGAMSLGHVGWAFDYSDSEVNAGAVENPAGTMVQAAGSDGYWDDFLLDPIPTVTLKGYQSLKYVNLEQGKPIAAYRVARWIGTKAYDVKGRNCLDDVYDVLRAYGVPELPLPSHDLLPNIWFDAFQAKLSNVAGFEWERPRMPEVNSRFARAVARFVPATVPTWRRPGHKDYKNLQAQLAAHKQ